MKNDARIRAQRISNIARVVGLGAFLTNGLGHAQTASSVASPDDLKLEEIVVTAERRSEDIQKIASSVTVRGGAEMLEEGKYSLKSILEDVPGIVGGAAEGLTGSAASGTDAAASGLIIRGIRSNRQPGGSITSVATAAAIYVDGVYEGVGGGYDLDRVEVLRGPQGTLYGRSATSGLVAIHTRNPDLSGLGGSAAVEAGNYSLRHYTGVLNAPITDTVGVRVAANRYERDGYYADEGGGARTGTDAKLKFLYQASDAFSVLLGFALQDNKTYSGGVSYTLTAPDTFTFTDAPVAPGENKYRQYWAEINWDLGAARLTYLPALRTWKSAAVNYLRNPVFNIDQSLRTPKDDFMTHELHLASNTESALIWQVGALYYRNDLENHILSVQYPSGALVFNSDTERQTTAVGAFAEATYPLTETWRLTGGLRYDSTKVEPQLAYTPANGVTTTVMPAEGTRRFNNWTYKFRVEHDLTPDNLLYASISTGFSPGDSALATGASGNAVLIVLEDQTLTAYEIGSKNRFLEERVQMNGSVYYYDYSGYQTAGVNTGPNPAAPTFTTLSSPAEVYGGELEFLYQLTAADRLGLNLAYTNAKYVDRTSTVLPDGRTFADLLAREEVADVVPVTANLSYEHTFELPGDSTLSLRGDARYLSAHDAGTATSEQLAAGALPYIRVKEQVLGNLSATWSLASGKYSFTGYVRNVGDTVYKTDLMVSALPTGVSVSGTPSEPRTYGAVLNVNF